jgi:hypothetical protein
VLDAEGAALAEVAGVADLAGGSVLSDEVFLSAFVSDCLALGTGAAASPHAIAAEETIRAETVRRIAVFMKDLLVGAAPSSALPTCTRQTITVEYVIM